VCAHTSDACSTVYAFVPLALCDISFITNLSLLLRSVLSSHPADDVAALGISYARAPRRFVVSSSSQQQPPQEPRADANQRLGGPLPSTGWRAAHAPPPVLPDLVGIVPSHVFFVFFAHSCRCVPLSRLLARLSVCPYMPAHVFHLCTCTVKPCPPFLFRSLLAI